MATAGAGEEFAAMLANPPKQPSTRWSGYYTAKTAGIHEIFAESPTDSEGGYRLTWTAS